MDCNDYRTSLPPQKIGIWHIQGREECLNSIWQMPLYLWQEGRKHKIRLIWPSSSFSPPTRKTGLFFVFLIPFQLSEKHLFFFGIFGMTANTGAIRLDGLMFSCCRATNLWFWRVFLIKKEKERGKMCKIIWWYTCEVSLWKWNDIKECEMKEKRERRDAAAAAAPAWCSCCYWTWLD